MTRVQVCEALDGSRIAIWWHGGRRRATVTVHERADGTIDCARMRRDLRANVVLHHSGGQVNP